MLWAETGHGAQSYTKDLCQQDIAGFRSSTRSLLYRDSGPPPAPGLIVRYRGIMVRWGRVKPLRILGLRSPSKGLRGLKNQLLYLLSYASLAQIGTDYIRPV